MNLPNQVFSKYKPEEQLELLRLQCKNLSTEIYKLNTLYLEDLILLLPEVVRKAVFSLLTEENYHPTITSSLEIKQSSFHHIDDLVSKAISKLTIEKLIYLADTLEKEKISKNKEKKQIILNQEKQNKNNDLTEISNKNSIFLSSEPPLINPARLEISFSKNEINSSNDIFLDDLSEESIIPSSIGIDQIDSAKEDINSTGTFENKTTYSLDAIKKIFTKAAIPFIRKNIEDQDPDLDSNSIESREWKEENSLPEDPLQLYQWMHSLDIALQRSLRDLSNSINVELLTSGLLNSLMPVAILDAVIEGQLSSQDTASNLLKLNIPINSSLPEEGLDVTCILLRSSELEFDFPRLRRYKSSLRKIRNILIKMIKQHRHWQNRLLANDVSQQWLQTPQTIPKTKNVKD